ncbi:MAG: GNAT family N-acetyltransferase [Tepidiformaceae bacterium]
MRRNRADHPVIVRVASAEDGSAVAALYQQSRPALTEAPADASAFEVMAQTGHAFLVAVQDGVVHGAVRFHDDDGIAWLDLLVADVPGVGRRLLRAVETGAQDRGLRLVRTRVPEGSRLPGVFGRWGYLPVAREAAPGGTSAGGAQLVLEKRMALLTVREQRRSDAAAIAALTGEDPWVFEQGARPGWFVAADGDRVVGTINVHDAGGGVAEFREPALLEPYQGRGIEVWMVERCAIYAETNGFHTAELPLTPRTDAHRKALEDRFWERGSERFVRRFLGNMRKPDEEWD